MRRALIICLSAILAFAWSNCCAQENRKDAENRFLDISDIVEEGRIKEALDSLNVLGQIDSTLDAVYYYKALCKFELNDVAGAEADILKAIQLDSTNVWYYEALAALYQKLGFRKQLADLYSTLVVRFPRHFANCITYTELGDNAYQSYNDSLAFKWYNEALVLDPDYVPAQLGLATVHKSRKNFPAFFRIMNDFARNEVYLPDVKVMVIERVIRSFSVVEYRAWRDQIDTMVLLLPQTHPTDSACVVFGGSWLYSNGNKKGAIDFLRKNIDENPGNIFSRELLVAAYSEMRDWSSVIEVAEGILLHCDGEHYLDALITIGDAYISLGKNKKGFKYYEKALAIDPRNSRVLNNYAYFLALTGKQLKKAEQMARLAVELDPDSSTTLDTLGWILHLRKKDAEAKTFFKRAMIFGGKDSAVVTMHYSIVLRALGEGSLADYYDHLSKKATSE